MPDETLNQTKVREKTVGNFKAVVFDMDGVLFDTELICLKAWKAVGEDYHIDDIERTAIGCIGLNLTDTKAFFEQKYGADIDFAFFKEECSRHIREAIEKDGLPLKPGVREILTFLKERDCRIALASSTAKSGVLRHIDRAGIREFFEVVIGGDMVEHSKPRPDIYLLACRELGVAPAEAIAVEDSPNGLRSAHAAGMWPVMVPDLIAPTPEIEKLLYARCDNLLAVRDFLRDKLGNVQEVERIPLKGLCNTRDLGGYRTMDGRRIKSHRLIRSGALLDGSEEDLQILLSRYGLKTVVDFRTGEERRQKPDPVLPGVTYVDNPILEEETMGITRENESSSDGNAVVKKVIDTIKTTGSTPLDYMKNMYINLIKNPFSRAQYRNFFEVLLAQEEGAVLWHCTAGKDRAGVGTLLLLSALSVPREQILADYMKVNEFARREIDFLMELLTSGEEKAAVRQEQADAVRLLFTVDEAYAASVFEVMEQECGSVEAFLEQKMGLTAEKRERLKALYLE